MKYTIKGKETKINELDLRMKGDCPTIYINGIDVAFFSFDGELLAKSNYAHEVEILTKLGYKLNGTYLKVK